MKRTKLIIFILAAVFAAGTATAQNTSRSAYFLDGYDFRHWLNPAIPSARNYFALPVLGTTNVTTQANIGIKNFLYPTSDGGLTTFMNGSVDGNQFLSKLHKKNIFSADLDANIASVGAWGRERRGFTTVDIGVKANAAVNLPYDLFSFVKKVGGSDHYDISKLGARVSSYVQVAVGESYRIDEHLTVGGKFKFLLGLADINFNIDKMSVDMTADQWSVQSQGSLRASSGLVSIPTYAETGNDGGAANEIDYNGIELGNSYIGGYGAALDLGAVYDGLIDGLTLSASILDFGFIRWKSSTYATTDNSSWLFNGFDDISLNEDSDNYIETQFNNLFSDFGDMAKVYRQGEAKPYTQMLAATIILAGEYKMPFYQPLSAGAMVTTHIQGTYTWAEARVSANLALADCFSFCVNYALSNFGSSFGSALNLHCKGLNFFFGMDTIPFRYTAALKNAGVGIPLGHANVNVNFGLAFNISNRLDRAATFSSKKTE